MRHGAGRERLLGVFLTLSIALVLGPLAPPSEAEAPVQADADSDGPTISGDGRYVAFTSPATNLVGADTNLVADVFVRDTLGSTPRRVSVSSSGQQANGPSGEPSISDDGRYVTFESTASNLVAGDTNGALDVFVYDRASGTLARASVSETGAQLAAGGRSAAIAGDGGRIAFVTRSAAIVQTECSPYFPEPDMNGVEDVYVYERASKRTVQLASAQTFEDPMGICGSGLQGSLAGNGASLNPSLSDDGRYVAFESRATDLYSSDTNAARDIIVRDLGYAATLSRVSRSDSGAQANGESAEPAISGDGRYVAFESRASNLVTRDVDGGADRDVNGLSDVFRHDRSTGRTLRVSKLQASTAEPNGGSYRPAISGDGRYVAFETDDTRFGADNGRRDVVEFGPVNYGWKTAPAINMLSASGGGDASGDSSSASTSSDGRFAAFRSCASGIYTPSYPDGNGKCDTFRHDGLGMHDWTTGVAPCKWLRVSDAAGAPDAEALAQRFRPNLRFDSGERWRPLEVERFIREGIHRRCKDVDWSPDTCRPLARWEDLRLDGVADYIDIEGDPQSGSSYSVSSYRSPTLNDACKGRLPENGDLLDCDTAPASAIYYHLVEQADDLTTPAHEDAYDYLDYWWFYRFNDAPAGFHHEGDWEGMTVARPKGSERFHWAAFAAHESGGAGWRYLREVLSCNGRGPGSCGIEEAPNDATHIDAYVAAGSHATYPRACDETPCNQTSPDGESSRPETDFDGARPWGGNGDPLALLAFPEPRGWNDPATASWVDWYAEDDDRGRWGGAAGVFVSPPPSPGKQRRFTHPGDGLGRCTERWTNPGDDCPVFQPLGYSSGGPTTVFAALSSEGQSEGEEPPGGEEPTEGEGATPPADEPPSDDEQSDGEEGSDAEEQEPDADPPLEEPGAPDGSPEDPGPEAPPSEDDLEERVCAPWRGPLVVVSLCEPEQLANALDRTKLDKDGEVRLRGEDHDAAEASAPGILQLLGDPLEPEETLSLEGEISPDAALTVRTEQGGELYESRFEDLDLGDDARLSVETETGVPVPEIVTEDGETIKPDAVESLDEDDERRPPEGEDRAG